MTTVPLTRELAQVLEVLRALRADGPQTLTALHLAMRERFPELLLPFGQESLRPRLTLLWIEGYVRRDISHERGGFVYEAVEPPTATPGA